MNLEGCLEVVKYAKFTNTTFLLKSQLKIKPSSSKRQFWTKISSQAGGKSKAETLLSIGRFGKDANAHWQDDEAAEKLWKLSEKMVGLNQRYSNRTLNFTGISVV